MLEFTVEPAGRQWCQAAAEVLDARVEPSRTERWAWFDTQDWRLWRAGLVLTHTSTSGSGHWVLTDDEHRTLASAPADPLPPVPAALPEGPLARRLAEIIGIRALLPRATAVGTVQVLAVVDDQAKTRTRVIVRGPTETDAGATIGAHAHVEVLRGYADDADRAGRALRGLPGTAPSSRSLPERVLRASGSTPGRYRSKPDVPMTPADPAGQVMAATFAQLLEVVTDNLDGTLMRFDTEFLHDLRVGLRRARTAVKFGRGALPDQVREHFRDELRWAARATSDSRDLDVYLLEFESMAARAGDPEGLADLHDLLLRRRESAHHDLNHALRSRRFALLLQDWADRLAVPASGTGTVPVGELATEALHRAGRRVNRRGRALDGDSPDEHLHDLRKRCKELRYLLEMFAPLPPGDHRRLVKRLKKLQDVMGAFRDAHVHHEMLAGTMTQLREEGSSGAALSAVARLEAHLDESKRAARAEIPRAWGRFDRPNSRRRWDRMLT